MSFGDYHVAANIGYVLTGEPVDDDGLAVLLEPYAGHRHRVQRLVELAGITRPRRGPRMAPRTHLPGRWPDPCRVPGRADLAGAPGHEGARHYLHPDRGVVAVESREQQVDAPGADLVGVLADHADGGFDHLGHGDLVEADQRDLGRQLLLVQGHHGPFADHVAGGEQGRGRVRKREQPGGCGARILPRAQPDPFESRVRHQARGAQRGTVPVEPVAGRGDGGGVAEERDAPVPVRQQVAHGLGGSSLVVDDDPVDLREGRPAVDR